MINNHSVLHNSVRFPSKITQFAHGEQSHRWCYKLCLLLQRHFCSNFLNRSLSLWKQSRLSCSLCSWTNGRSAQALFSDISDSNPGKSFKILHDTDTPPVSSPHSLCSLTFSHWSDSVEMLLLDLSSTELQREQKDSRMFLTKTQNNYNKCVMIIQL